MKPKFTLYDLIEALSLDSVHRHKCPQCGTVWEHSNRCALDATRSVYLQSHTCPQCGKANVIAKYFGDDPVNATQQCVQDGVLLEWK